MIFSPRESAAPQKKIPLPGHLRKYATPLHIYEEKPALEDARALKQGLFSGLRGAELYYSVKTNPLLPLLRSLLKEGFGMEVVGPHNLSAALEAGCAPELLLLNGAAWAEDEMRAALALGVRSITIDSVPMAQLFARAWKRGPKVNIAFRIHDGQSHFGLSLPALREVLGEIPAKAIESVGLHIHSNPHGSAPGIDAIREDFSQRARLLKSAMALLPHETEFIDLGGGIDTPFVYRPHPHELGRFHNPGETEKFRGEITSPRFDLEEAGAAVAEAVIAELGDEWREKRVMFEPGRAVCTRALSTLIAVRAVKKGFYPDAEVVITDGATSFLGPLHRGIYPIEPKGSLRTFVYGALPHSGDWLYQGARLPALKEGDQLLIKYTGAYFLSLEAEFGHELPMIVRADRDEIVRAKEPRAPRSGLRHPPKPRKATKKR